MHMTSAPPYSAAEYWEQRYIDRPTQETFEWYGDLATFEAPILSVLPSADTLILHIGSGNSKLPEQLWEHGFRHQLASDVAPSAISRMRARCAHLEGLCWSVDDALSMSHPSCSIHVVIDKGTYDALSCDSCTARQLIVEVHRILKAGGVYVLISSLESTALAFGSPYWQPGEWDVRSEHADGGLRGGGWVHCATKRSTEGVSDPSSLQPCSHDCADEETSLVDS